MKFIETSAKTSENVEEAFTDTTKDIVKLMKDKNSDRSKEPKIDISKGKSKDLLTKNAKCCN